MLREKFQDYQNLVLEKILCYIFIIYRRGCHLGHVTWTIYINFRVLFPRRLHMKFGLIGLIGQAISEIFENGGRRRHTADDRRQRTPEYGYKLHVLIL